METPLELFHCRRQNMRLTAGGCSRLWLSAQEKENEPQAWEGRSACVTCPIGATNSGRVVSPVAEEVATLKRVCPRCMRVAPRLINHRLCVSCYNRQAEADKGKNAKGTRPRLCDRLHEIDVTVVAGHGVHIIHSARVTGATEVIVHIARRAKATTFFGWVAAGPGDAEALLHE